MICLNLKDEFKGKVHIYEYIPNGTTTLHKIFITSPLTPEEADKILKLILPLRIYMLVIYKQDEDVKDWKYEQWQRSDFDEIYEKNCERRYLNTKKDFDYIFKAWGL